MRVTIFVVENHYSKYKIFWLCVCSFSYAALKAHVPGNVCISD